nr:serine/threonine-protein kinase [Streptomyces sp. SID3343]
MGESLGRGGMGTVWLAYDELLRREVAIKEVRIPDDLDEMETQGRCERALREARAAARITHPNVVTIFDVAEDDGRPWIVMELVRAPSLTDVLDEGRMAPHEAAEVGLAVLHALRAARVADVLHRDVKPSNILMAPGGRVVLTDFGIATVAGSVTLTATGMLVGSPEYLAPERVLGRRPGPASDLWSLGVTLYQAVEGFSPFRRTGAMDTLTAVLTDEAAPPRRAGALWPAIEGLLRKDPLERADEDSTERMLLAAMTAGGAEAPPPTPPPDATATVENPHGARGVTRSSWQQAPPPLPLPLPPTGAASAADPDGPTGGYPQTGARAYLPADAVPGAVTADDRVRPVLPGPSPTGPSVSDPVPIGVPRPTPTEAAARKRRKIVVLGALVVAAVTALAILVPAAMGDGKDDHPGSDKRSTAPGTSSGPPPAAPGAASPGQAVHTGGASASAPDDTDDDGTTNGNGNGNGNGTNTGDPDTHSTPTTRATRPTTTPTRTPTTRPPTTKPPTSKPPTGGSTAKPTTSVTTPASAGGGGSDKAASGSSAGPTA